MKLINKILNFSTGKPIVIFIIVLVISLALFPGSLRLKQDNDFHGYLDPTDDILLYLNYMENIFHSGGSTVFIAIESNNIYSYGVLDYVNKLHKAIEKLKEFPDKIKTSEFNEFASKDISEEEKQILLDCYKQSKDGEYYVLKENLNKDEEEKLEKPLSFLGYMGVKKVTSVINMEDISYEDDALRAVELIENDDNGDEIIPKTEEQQALLKQKVESNKKFKAFIISKQGNAWNIYVELEEMRIFDNIVNTIEKTIHEFNISEPTNENIYYTHKDGYKTYFSGEAYTLKELNGESRRDLFIQVGLVVIVICIVYFLNFKSVRGVVFPLLINLVSALWTYSIIGYAGIKLSIIGLLMIPLLVAVGSSYTIHTLNQYYKESHTFTDQYKKKQIAQSGEHIAKTIVLAGLTTMIGIGSLITSPITHLKTFGLYAGIGVAISVILSLTFLPSLLSVVKIPKRYKKEKTFSDTLFDKAMEKIIKFIIKRKFIVFFVMVGIMAVSIIGIFRISTASSSGNFFSEEHKVRKLLDYFGENFDGVSNMDIVIDLNPDYEYSVKNDINSIKERMKNPDKAFGEEKTSTKDKTETETKTETNKTDETDPFATDVFDNDTKTNEVGKDLSDIKANPNKSKALNPKILKIIDELMRDAEKEIPGVGRSYSFVDIQKRFNYAMHKNNPAYDVVPETEELLKDYMELFSGVDDNNDGLPDIFEKFLDPSQNKLRITMKLKNVNNKIITSEDFRQIENALKSRIDKRFEDLKANDKDYKDFNIYYYITGNSVLFRSIQDNIVTGQIISIIFSLIVMAIVTLILFDSFKVGLISLIPLSFAVIVNFGIMGFTGIVLNIGTSLIASFTIGIGIDDTIHFLLNLRKEMKSNNMRYRDLKKEEVEALIYNNLKYTSKAIVFTSLALIFGFMVVIFSTFMPVRNFSILLALTMVNTTIATLMLLSATILIFPRLIKTKKPKPLGSFSGYSRRIK